MQKSFALGIIIFLASATQTFAETSCISEVSPQDSTAQTAFLRDLNRVDSMCATADSAPDRYKCLQRGFEPLKTGATGPRLLNTLCEEMSTYPSTFNCYKKGVNVFNTEKLKIIERTCEKAKSDSGKQSCYGRAIALFSKETRTPTNTDLFTLINKSCTILTTYDLSNSCMNRGMNSLRSQHSLTATITHICSSIPSESDSSNCYREALTNSGNKDLKKIGIDCWHNTNSYAAAKSCFDRELEVRQALMDIEAQFNQLPVADSGQPRCVSDNRRLRQNNQDYSANPDERRSDEFQSGRAK